MRLGAGATLPIQFKVINMADMEPQVSWRFTQTATTNTLVTVDVVNERVIWAAGGGFSPNGGSVMRTIDGGQNWTDVTPPDPQDEASQVFRAVKAFDAARAVVLAIDFFVESSGIIKPSRIYRTVNGGETWSPTFTNDNERVSYSGMAFFDDRRGLAVSDSIDGSFLIQTTTNGGESWELDSSAEVPPALEGGEGIFATGTSLLTVGERDAWFGVTGTGQSPRVFHTSNGGTTWTVANTPIPGSDNGRAGLRSLSFRDRRHGLLVGGTPPTDDTAGLGFAARTSDGGQTWDLVGTPTGFRNGVAWISGQTAIAVGNPGSDVSFNAGQTWARFNDTFLLGVNCSSPDVCWAVGDGGKAARLRRKQPPANGNGL
jgi:photosystem II stability/assembly factor-like uncharacterized protein